MRKFSMKLLAMTAITGMGALAFSGAALAADQDVDASAEFRQAIALTKNNDIDFSSGGVIEYSAPGATDFVEMGTDGNINYNGTGYSGPATGTVGDVSLTGAAGATVDISCDATATISDGSNTLTVDNVQISVDTGQAYGSASACAGLGTASISPAISAPDNILIGGRIDGGSGTTADGVYDSTQAGGDPVTVRVVYQ